MFLSKYILYNYVILYIRFVLHTYISNRFSSFVTTIYLIQLVFSSFNDNKNIKKIERRMQRDPIVVVRTKDDLVLDEGAEHIFYLFMLSERGRGKVYDKVLRKVEGVQDLRELKTLVTP